MPNVRAQFGGLNRDKSPLKVPSGTASAALNVVIEDGRPKKRLGFSELEDSISSTLGIVGLFVAHFDCGTWLFAKLTNGTCWVRQLDPIDDLTFSQLTTFHTHSGSDPGWAYMWHDRFIYCDRGGVSQWHPYVAGKVLLKAGMPKPATGPRATAATKGQLQGRYHAHYSFYSKSLDVEGVVSEPSMLANGSAGALETNMSDSYGGMTISTYLFPYGYEADMIRVYRTMGNTEYQEIGDVAREVTSWKAAIDVQVALGTTPGLYRADSALDWSNLFTNSGGEPPASRWGAWTGGICVYAGGDPGTKASLTVDPDGDDNNFTVTAKSEGYWGNRISVEVTARDPVDEDPVPVITVTNMSTSTGRGLIKISIEVNAGVLPEDQTTAADVVAALNSVENAAELFIDAAIVSGQSGTGLVTAAIEEDYLEGGVDAAADIIYYSIPFRPTMVPQPVEYQWTNDAAAVELKTVEPKPWRGQIVSGLDGRCVEMANAGGTVCAFTSTATYRLRSAANGQLYPTLVHGGVGCVGHGAACNAGSEVHAIGYRTWSVITATTWDCISDGRFKSTLQEIPVTEQEHTRMATYAYANQVWAAVVKADETEARRILVWDRDLAGGSLLMFEPAMFDTDNDEGITWMCELARSGAEPKMLLATSRGRIFQYPAAVARDSQTVDAETAYSEYAATWTGIFGSERSGYSQKLMAIELHCGANCSGYLNWALATKRTADDSPTARTGTVQADNGVVTMEGTITRTDGRLYELTLSSAAVNSGQWVVEDVTFKIDRTDLSR